MMILIGFIAGIFFTLLILWSFLPGKMFLVSESKYGFDETLEQISRSVKENGWSIPNQYDLQATLEKHGHKVLPVKVFSVCQPGLANQLLGNNHSRFVSALMPCRISVYITADGRTYVSRLNAGLFSSLLSSKIRKTMKEAALGGERILEPVVKKE